MRQYLVKINFCKSNLSIKQCEYRANGSAPFGLNQKRLRQLEPQLHWWNQYPISVLDTVSESLIGHCVRSLIGYQRARMLTSGSDTLSETTSNIMTTQQVTGQTHLLISSHNPDFGPRRIQSGWTPPLIYFFYLVQVPIPVFIPYLGRLGIS